MRANNRKHLWFWALLPVLASIPLRNALNWDLREDTIAFAALLGACTAIQRERWVTFGVCASIAMLSKENLPFITLFLAVPVVAGRRNWRRFLIGGVVLAASVAYGYVALRLLLPYYAGDSAHGADLTKRFADFGPTPIEVLRNVLLFPSAWVRLFVERILKASTAKYLVLLCGPFLLFWRRPSWPWLVPALPGIAMNLLSSKDSQRSLYFHYDWVVLPFLIFAAWVGIASGLERSRRLKPALILLLVLACSGRWPGSILRHYWPTHAELQTSNQLKAIVNRIQGTGVLVAPDRAAMAHLSKVPGKKLVPLIPPDSPTCDWRDGHREVNSALLNTKSDAEDAFARQLLRCGWGPSEYSGLSPGPYVFLVKR